MLIRQEYSNGIQQFPDSDHVLQHDDEKKYATSKVSISLKLENLLSKSSAAFSQIFIPQ